ncbi:MAG: hypothetical protein OXI15_16455 [Chromatiales bacterium]|nr:hypothetical protein [Chromatiales bacterium]
MCIIVDTSRMGDFLADPPGDDAAPIRRWLDTGSGSVVYSTAGKFADEIRGHARQRLLRYSQAGKAKFVPEDRFIDDQNTLEGQIRSDDPHVLALARATGVRLLYTGDADLIADFKDKAFLDKPRGKIYSGAANANLLTRSACAR